MSEKLCLQWNDFKDNTISAFGSLREDNDFADVTLACEDGKQVEVHKVVLATSSPFFQKILKRNKHAHPLIYMRGVNSDDLLSIMDFLYFGKANVYQENLDSFLAIAGELQLKGLTTKDDIEDEVRQERNSNTSFPRPKKVNPIHNEERNVPSMSNIGEQIKSNDFEGVLMTLNHEGEIKELGNASQLDEMMEKTLRKMPNGNPLYKCKVCGKEAINAHIKSHIETRHLEGFSISCNFCKNTFRSRHSLAQHNRVHHNGQRNMI